MALRFIDGFDHYNTTAQFSLKYNEAVGSTGYPCVEPGRRAGSNSVRLYAQSSYLNKTLDDQSTWIVGAAVKIGVMPSSNGAIFQFRDNTGNNQACVCITPSGNVALVRGSSSGTVLATSTNAILANSWNFIETKLTIADSGGTFEARVNGDVWVTYTGDTKYSSTLNTANSLRLSGLPSAVHAWYDDLYICDGTGSTNNTFLGDARVDTILPNGVGASAQFSPTGSANNWENVDDPSPDDEATYNASNTAGNIDSFAFADISSLGATVFGIQENMLSRKDDAGSRILRGITRIGATNYEGLDITLTDSYVYQRQIWEKNPATAANWSEADINAAEFGYKVQT